MNVKFGVAAPVIVRIQSVLCVNKDDFPAWVCLLAWQLSGDWRNITQSQSFAIYLFAHNFFKGLLTHHKVCETAGFSLCGTLCDETI